jgi:hypothetical protein
MSKSKTGARRAQPKRNRAAANDAEPPHTKTCRVCSHTKPLELMKKARHGKRTSICKSCDAEYQRGRRAADPEGYRRKSREWRRHHPRGERERAANGARARTPRGRELNLVAVRRYQARHREVKAAQKKAQSARRQGELVVSVCQVLGCARTDDLHLHHRRYDGAHVHDVDALCRHHHEHVHHRGALELKPGGRRRWARAPRHEVRAS